MRSKSILFIVLGIFVMGFVVAQIAVVPVIPQSFNVALPSLPLVNGQVFGNCPYTPSQVSLGTLKVWSNNLQSVGVGNITYEFQIKQPRCIQSFYRSFTYNLLANPVTEIQSDLDITILTAIHLPENTIQPIAIGV